MKRAFLILCFSVVLGSSVFKSLAQESPSPSPTLVVPAAAVNVADPAAATQAWLATVPAEKRARSDAYFEGGYWLLLWNFLLGVAISIFLLHSRISARIRDRAERTTQFKAVQVAIYAISFISLTWALSFPLTVYQEFFREHQYGMATQTFGPWFAEQIKALVIVLIFGSLVLIVLYAVFRRASHTWPIWGAIVAVFFSILGNFIFPVFVEPVFNTYKPITDPAIRDPILALARANEIPVDQVFEFDASRQTKRISANVAGFFGTTRIALNDNLMKRCTLPEVRHVMGHEMGHYVLNHGVKLVMYFGIVAFLGLMIARGVFDKAVQRWGTRWGVRGIADPAGLPLLALIIGVYSFILTPLSNSNIRIIEREADAFGINTAREPDAFAAVSLKLGEYRKLDPGKWEEIIFFDHPSGRARIRMAMDWKAAHLPCGNAQ
ncbi:MAG: endopeptidase [Verrucomicrobiota bacterium]